MAILLLVLLGAFLLLGLVAIAGMVRKTRNIRLGRNVEAAARKMKQPAAGMLQVTGVSAPSAEEVWKSCRITGVLSAEGVEPRPVQQEELITTSMWPKPGDALPVLVDRADPARFLVEWKKVRARDADAFEEAERLASAMRARTG